MITSAHSKDQSINSLDVNRELRVNREVTKVKDAYHIVSVLLMLEKLMLNLAIDMLAALSKSQLLQRL